MIAQYWQLFAFAALVVTTLLPAFFLFDSLVEHEHDWHPDSWEEDGRPSGYGSSPEGASRFSTGHHWLFLSWLLSTPEWVRSDRSCRRFLLWMRILVILWFVGLVLIGLGSRTFDRRQPPNQPTETTRGN